MSSLSENYASLLSVNSITKTLLIKNYSKKKKGKCSRIWNVILGSLDPLITHTYHTHTHTDTHTHTHNTLNFFHMVGSYTFSCPQNTTKYNASKFWYHSAPHHWGCCQYTCYFPLHDALLMHPQTLIKQDSLNVLV